VTEDFRIAAERDRMPTALYRLYGEDDILLYVGITGNPSTRFAQHAADKHWWPNVVRKDVEWYTRRSYALAAEEAAIRKHGPVWNREHSPEWPNIPVTVEISARQKEGLELLARSLTYAGEAPPIDVMLYILMDRELLARGLLGNSPCYHSSIAWPDGVEVAKAGEACSCGYILTSDCSPIDPEVRRKVSDDVSSA